MIEIPDMQGTGQSIRLGKVVIKLGSAVIAGKGSQMDMAAMTSLADSVATLREKGVQVVIVSSGAIGMGRRIFEDFKPRTIPDRQALAAIGQVGLMHTYKTLFNERGFRAAQVLLTRDDMEDRRRYLNARYTLERLLELGVVPVINENDTVTIDELQFGDNDELSAVVATKINADLLIILTTIDGLYSIDPASGEGDREKGQLIPVVKTIDESIMGVAGQSRSNLGTGGMATKLTAVRVATHGGVHAAIACGKTPGIIDQIVSGQFRGTYFIPGKQRQLTGKDRWIAYGRKACGRILIDAGACEALVTRKKSLLPAGICAVEGSFDCGDLVEVIAPDGKRIAKGLSNYSAEDIERIKGKKTSQLREILGDLRYKEVIHRDNLVMI